MIVNCAHCGGKIEVSGVVSPDPEAEKREAAAEKRRAYMREYMRGYDRKGSKAEKPRADLDDELD